MTVFCHMYLFSSGSRRELPSQYGRGIHTLRSGRAGMVEAVAKRFGCGCVVRIAGCGDDLVPARGDAVAGQAGIGERVAVPLY